VVVVVVVVEVVEVEDEVSRTSWTTLGLDLLGDPGVWFPRCVNLVGLFTTGPKAAARPLIFPEDVSSESKDPRPLVWSCGFGFGNGIQLGSGRNLP